MGHGAGPQAPPSAEHERFGKASLMRRASSPGEAHRAGLPVAGAPAEPDMLMMRLPAEIVQKPTPAEHRFLRWA
jgi:hypothetical protein